MFKVTSESQAFIVGVVVFVICTVLLVCLAMSMVVYTHPGYFHAGSVAHISPIWWWLPVYRPYYYPLHRRVTVVHRHARPVVARGRAVRSVARPAMARRAMARPAMIQGK